MNAVQHIDMKICKQISDHLERLHDHSPDIFVIDDKYGSQCPYMQHDVEQHAAVCINVKNILQNREMSGAAHRQELRDPLYDSKKNRLQYAHNTPPDSVR